MEHDMNKKQETVADIVAEMRDRKKMLGSAISSAPLCYPVDGMEAKVEILDEFIDRIEAAYRVEKLIWVEANAGLAKLVDPMTGSHQPIGCCDAECAGVNHCRIGGYQCRKCGRWFCASELNEQGLCGDCAGEGEE